MAVACLKPIVILILPFAVGWLLSSYTPIRNKWTLRLVALLMAVQVACFALVPAVLIIIGQFGQYLETVWTQGGNGETTMTVDGQRVVTHSATAGLLPYRPGEAPEPLNALHSRGGEWAGRDYTRPCGTPIIAPFDGKVTRGGAGAIDGWNNTYMYVQSADEQYDMLIMHSDFYLSAGESFSAGQQIGATNTIGYSSECHEHISLLVNGIEADPESYRETAVAPVVQDSPARDIAALTKALAALGYHDGKSNDGSALRVSAYTPIIDGQWATGTTNCDADCSTMASGQKTLDWVGGQNGIYAAACPPEWPFGTRFELYGKVYQCQDRGGWIQTRHAGEYDPAMGGFTAGETYHWVDLLDTPPVPYGTLVYDWQFVD